MALALSLALAFVSCAKPPTEEINAAQAALDGAKSAEADVYAGATYKSAAAALDEARAQVEEKKYEEAKASAIRAKELAERSSTEAETGKQKTRDEAQALINRLTVGLADVRTALDNAPQGKGADEDLDQLRASLAQAEAGLTDAKGSLGNAKFKDALDQAGAAESKLTEVQSGVQTAMEKIEDWKKENRPWYEL
jgi:hypothetical protein